MLMLPPVIVFRDISSCYEAWRLEQLLCAEMLRSLTKSMAEPDSEKHDCEWRPRSAE